MTKRAFLFLVFFCFLAASYGQKTIISGNIKNLPGKQSIKCSFIVKNILEDITAIAIPTTEGILNTN